MPEGDVVWLAARQLARALDGQLLTRSDFRVPRYATTDLTGRTVTGTVSRGKHLLTRVDGGLTVHTHLRMDGSWRVRPAGGRPRLDHRVRLVLANDAWQAIGVLLGIVEVLRLAALDANKERVGIVTTGSQRRGEGTWAYGRAGQPCRRCGTTIRRAEQGDAGEERGRFWCPACQR